MSTLGAHSPTIAGGQGTGYPARYGGTLPGRAGYQYPGYTPVMPRPRHDLPQPAVPRPPADGRPPGLKRALRARVGKVGSALARFRY